MTETILIVDQNGEFTGVQVPYNEKEYWKFVLNYGEIKKGDPTMVMSYQ